MARVAVIVGDLFEDSEYTDPVEAFRENGHEVVNVGVAKGATVTGKKHGTEVTIDRAVAGESAEDYDALLIPGGYSPDKVRRDEDAVRFTRRFFLFDKPVFVICHGAQLLVSAEVLTGLRMTAHHSVKQDIKNAGAVYFDHELVVDRNLVSSRDPGDLPVFIEAALEKLK